ncbi:MAG TPA: carboxypeptidase regulatory-like domain-containing protein [Gemmatimonadales bacterium]
MIAARRILAPALLVVVTSTVAPTAVPAQAALRGRVIDSEMGTPLVGATVQVGKGGRVVKTDSAGQFLAQYVTPGTTAIEIKQIGYEPGTFDIRVPDSGLVQGVFPLDFNGYLLPAVVVEARAAALMPRYNEFEQRRQRKMGAYLRWDEIKKQGYNSVGDALRTVRGVRIECNQQTFECNAVMVRTPQCRPTWYIDGVEAHSFHENTPIIDVYGIEVYRGAGEIPAEFAGSNAACGVIVVWTKSKPYR